jgi:hypothetical protein
MSKIRMRISREAMLRKRLLEPGWYVLVIKKLFTELAKDEKSTNTIVDLTVVSTEEGSDRDEGVPLRRYFSEKAEEYSESFITALGGDVSEESGFDGEFDDETIKGRKLLGLVGNRDAGGGQMRNEVEEFRPLEDAA